jgi:glycosyltransferase involved in cell wall biosynthesis
MRVVVAAYAHPDDRIGGAEYQTSLIAEGLARRGHDVTFLATDAGTEATLRKDTLTIVKLPGWRMVGDARHQQMLQATIARIQPDLCYIRVFEELAALGGICKAAGVPVVSASSHVLETMPLLVVRSPKKTLWYLLSSLTSKHLRSFCSVHSSAAHVCNTSDLQQRIQPWFPHRRILTIYNGSPQPAPEEIHSGASGQVIWVNNLKGWKRPEVFLRLAQKLPAYRFVMIGSMARGRFGKQVQAWLQQAPANVHYLGAQPIAEVNRQIGQSDLLLYTSLPREGFGNSFLQAWLRGVPTVSYTFELDGILEREQVGRCAHTFEQLVADVDALMQDHAQRQAMGQRARAYALRYHSVEALVDSFEILFRSIVSVAPRGAAAALAEQQAGGI